MRIPGVTAMRGESEIPLCGVAASCVAENVCPAMVAEADRLLPELVGAVKCTVLLPVPEVVSSISQSTGLLAAQAQLESEALMEMACDAPAAEYLFDNGEMENVQEIVPP